MKDWIVYFFGQGTDVEFSLFTAAHFAPVVLMVLVIWLIYKKRDSLAQSRYEEKIRYAMAFALIICDMSYYWRLVGMPSLQPSAVENLPIGICAWTVIFASFMMVGKNQNLFDIIYFWLFSGSLFALITPHPTDLHRSYPVPVLSVLAGAYSGLHFCLLYDLCPQNASHGPLGGEILCGYGADGSVCLLGQHHDPRCQLSVYGPAGGCAFRSGYPASQFCTSGEHHGLCHGGDVCAGISSLVSAG